MSSASFPIQEMPQERSDAIARQGLVFAPRNAMEYYGPWDAKEDNCKNTLLSFDEPARSQLIDGTDFFAFTTGDFDLLFTAPPANRPRQGHSLWLLEDGVALGPREAAVYYRDHGREDELDSTLHSFRSLAPGFLRASREQEALEIEAASPSKASSRPGI